MIKNLEAFKEIREYLDYIFYDKRVSKAISVTSTSRYLEPFMTIIESALKEYEELQQILDDFHIYNFGNLIDTLKNIRFLENDNHFYKYMISSICDYMGLDIKPFEDLVATENAMKDYICENECFRVEVATNKNKLKALEIIKEKDVNIDLLRKCPYIEFYNKKVNKYRQLTQEEYNLLKEVLL